MRAPAGEMGTDAEVVSGCRPGPGAARQPQFLASGLEGVGWGVAKSQEVGKGLGGVRTRASGDLPVTFGKGRPHCAHMTHRERRTRPPARLVGK